ncbi:MAG: MerR family transcriptional regulator, partial [Ostreibacterium sp.]
YEYGEGIVKVSQLAEIAKVSKDTVRYYTREGLLSASRNPHNGYQVYDQIALDRLRFITQARSLGFSLKDISHILQHAAHGNSPCPMVRDLLQSKITETENKMVALQMALSKMKVALLEWQKKPDGMPDGTSVCHLIEELT